ncbi:MAG TPA: glycosyltransferase family 4 protein [Solirubrobacteraceae bacterium]|nr:glycosyltransferase family 4 protein [Solirubrobacteraceae bacterium]
MPSVLAVAPVDEPGGAEIGLLRLLPRLRALGWSVTLTTPGAGPLRAAAARQGLATETLRLGGLARGAGARAVAAWPAARRLARRHDVVYLNGTVCGRLLPALPPGRRVVLHVHDMVERVPRMWRRADVVLADSRAVARRLAPLRPHVVGCPIEPDPAAVEPPWPRDERPVVGYVGRIEPRKGVLDLARAAPRLVAAGARVVVVGDDPFGSDPGYLRAVDASPDIERYGWVEGAAGLMGALDVLVLPSREEPFGTVLAEAMNAGTPVVATRVGGLEEVVDDGVTGRLVPPGDVDALAAAVLDVLARRETLGAAGRARAERWHADRYARDVAELIAP